MGMLEGRVAIVTGAGRGLGREHARLLASEGARVVVNDLGGGMDGSGTDGAAAKQVVAEIAAAGGEAVASADDVADWEGARRLVDTAVERFGGLDILVNNAGILRDRTLANMAEDEWDAVISVHLKGHFAPTRWAVSYWRERAKEGAVVKASVINTSSASGLVGNYGQSNYGAAKAGVAAFTVIGAMETARYGVRMNAIAPVGRTRLTMATPGMEAMAPADNGSFDFHHPGNISPLVAYLATAGCPVSGGVFHVAGNQVGLFGGWELEATVETEGRWEIADLEEAIPRLCRGKTGMVSVRTGMDSFGGLIGGEVR
ncbi:SDR family oxidoreductase [Actinomadura sp. 3N407]|uniref:SDR family oxidoreductase n=1 Tax=Actinomadura sp. 3N407 TaxID=3457423 RepID=UPI003FCD1BD6